MIYFWGSSIRLDVLEAVYEFNLYDRYDWGIFFKIGEIY